MSLEVWNKIIKEVSHLDNKHNKLLESFVLNQPDYKSALANLINESLKGHSYYHDGLGEIIFNALHNDKETLNNSLLDIYAYHERDPACNNLYEAFLFYKGFKALSLYRISHYYWVKNDFFTARLLQCIKSDIYSMDIHPAAVLAGGLFIDHGTGIVIGETSKVGKNVSILHNVTLGGTGKDLVDRHPKIHEGVLLGAGSTVLGNITIGKNSRVGAGSMVLKEVPENVTVIGIPAKISSYNKDAIPAREMNQV
ncbi:serine O-acetyltransferase EpsC [Methylophaga sp.]|uniref:serine O-acetyltransferase EpsC n=1 Tax=Methylophaga sp. TaxID=2024840 RepID=UPI003A8E7A60